jgi:hypothetical protein
MMAQPMSDELARVSAGFERPTMPGDPILQLPLNQYILAGEPGRGRR